MLLSGQNAGVWMRTAIVVVLAVLVTVPVVLFR